MTSKSKPAAKTTATAAVKRVRKSRAKTNVFESAYNSAKSTVSEASDSLAKKASELGNGVSETFNAGVALCSAVVGKASDEASSFLDRQVNPSRNFTAEELEIVARYNEASTPIILPVIDGTYCGVLCGIGAMAVAAPTVLGVIGAVASGVFVGGMVGYGCSIWIDRAFIPAEVYMKKRVSSLDNSKFFEQTVAASVPAAA